MLYLLIGLFLFTAFIMFIKGLSSPHPEKIKKAGLYLAAIFAIITLFFLIRAGLPIIAGLIAAVFALIPYFGRFVQLLQTAKSLKKFFTEEKLIKFIDKQISRLRRKRDNDEKK